MDTWLNSLTAGEECVHSLQLCGDSIKDIVMLLTGFGALHSEASVLICWPWCSFGSRKWPRLGTECIGAPHRHDMPAN